MTKRTKGIAATASALAVAGVVAILNQATVPPTTGPSFPEIAPNPAIKTGKVIVWADHRSGRLRRTFSGAMGLPVLDPIPAPPLAHCMAAMAGQVSPDGFYLCAGGGTQWVWHEWLWVAPPPLVPCGPSLAHQEMNGYACVEGKAGGHYWKGVTRR